MLFIRMTHKSGLLLRQKYTFFIFQKNEEKAATVPADNLSTLSLIFSRHDISEHLQYGH